MSAANRELGCGHSVQYATRAHKIEVDRCADCPFVSHITSTCAHPARTEYAKTVSAAELFSTLSLGDRLRHQDRSPPDWCPLRGAVTLVAGPRID